MKNTKKKYLRRLHSSVSDKSCFPGKQIGFVVMNTLFDIVTVMQGGHGTGKTGNLVLTFPERENTGNFVVTQGKFLRHRENIFDCIY